MAESTSAARGPAPFQLTYTPHIPELLRRLECSLVISTYQAGKLVFLSAPRDDRLVQLPRSFSRAMAIGQRSDHLAVATMDTVEVYAQDRRLAPGYPHQPETYDSLFAPRLTYYTGRIDCHGLNWGTDGLWAVNTTFGCLSLLSTRYSFEPRWKPPWVSEVAPEDRCHLNGVAFRDERPAYASCLSTSDERQGWRKTIPGGGVIVDVQRNDIVLENLPMPHSPRLVGGKLYFLLSATGQLARGNPETGRYEVIQDLGGFVRGLEHHRDYLFIGLSKLRQNASTFRDLDIAKTATYSGVAIVHEPTGAFVGEIRYQQTVDEIFDVTVVPGALRPGIVSLERNDRADGISMPEKTYWAVRDATQHHGGSDEEAGSSTNGQSRK